MAGRARLLDLDGTLVLTHGFYAAGVAAAGVHSETQVLEALRAGQSIVTLMRAAGIPPASLLRGLRGLTAVAGWDDTLAELKARGYRVGVVTSLPQWLARGILDEVRLLAHIDVVQSAARKPSARPIAAALSRLGLVASIDDLYVGDTELDARSAELAGIGFAWVSWGYGAPSGRAIYRPQDLLS